MLALSSEHGATVWHRTRLCGIGAADRRVGGVARRVGQPLVDRAYEHRAEVVACDGESCRWRIRRPIGLSAKYPVELLVHALVTNGAAP